VLTIKLTMTVDRNITSDGLSSLSFVQSDDAVASNFYGANMFRRRSQ
jgi:hypothetical protein